MTRPRRKLAVGFGLVLMAFLLYTPECLLCLLEYRRLDAHQAAFELKYPNRSRQDFANIMGVKISLNGRWYRELGVKPPVNFPVGTFPSAQVVGFKEGDGGEYPIHTTDKYGFFNKNEWWEDADVLIMGDSHVTCEHLHTNSITRSLRARGVKAVNLGVTSSGPVLQTIGFFSYRKHLPQDMQANVKAVIWLFCDWNDFQDAVEEWSYRPYRDAVCEGESHVPCLGYLDELAKVRREPYGPVYVLSSALCFKRTRAFLRLIGKQDLAVDVWEKSIQSVQRGGFAQVPRVILVHIPSPNYEHNKEAVERLVKKTQCEYILFPREGKYYSKGRFDVHLNRMGIEKQADMILERL